MARSKEREDQSRLLIKECSLYKCIMEMWIINDIEFKMQTIGKLHKMSTIELQLKIKKQ